MIEGKLKGIPWVSQAVVVGDRQKHLSALLTIDETKFEDALSQAGSSAKSTEDAADDDKLHAFMMKEVEKVNADLARVQTIKKIKILPSELTIEGGELTPTMKVKRKIVNQKYQEFIDEFYGGFTEDGCSPTPGEGQPIREQDFLMSVTYDTQRNAQGSFASYTVTQKDEWGNKKVDTVVPAQGALEGALRAKMKPETVWCSWIR